MDNKPAKVFNGNIFFYLVKVCMTLTSILLLGISLFVLTMFASVVITEGAAGMDPIDNVFLPAGFSVLICICLVLVFSHAFPIFSVSEKGLWYRHFLRWRLLPWKDIQEIHFARTLFLKFGLVVYSRNLPVYYWFYGGAYGRRKGRALLVLNQLRGFNELKTEIIRHIPMSDNG